MATDSSLEMDTQTCRISGGSSNHIEDDNAETRQQLCKANTLVTLTYTVESQVDEGVAGLGTCQQNAVTTVIVDPDDPYVGGEAPPTMGVRGVAEAESPQYICQSCSLLTPLDSCYCAHCGHKRGRGRPRGVTCPRGQAIMGKTPRVKHDGQGEAGLSVPSPPSSSPPVHLHGPQTTPFRQVSHNTLPPMFHLGKPYLNKKTTLLHCRPQGCDSGGWGEGLNQPQGVPPSRDPPTYGLSPLQYPVTTPIVTIPIYPEGDEPSDYHGNTDRSPSSCHVTLHNDEQFSVAGGGSDDGGDGENSVVGGATCVTKTEGCNWSFRSDQFQNISIPLLSSSLHKPSGTCARTDVTTQCSQGSTNGPLLLPRPPLRHSEPSQPSNQATPPHTTSHLHSDNSDLVVYHVDMSVSSPHTTPIVMTVGNPKDSQGVMGDRPKYVLFQSRQPGEEALSGPTPHATTKFAPIFHPPLAPYAVASRSNGSIVYSQAPMGNTPPVGYQLLHPPQNFAPQGVVRCPTMVDGHGISFAPLQAVWTPSMKYEGCGQGQTSYQIVESLPPPPSAPHRVPTSPLGFKQGSVGGRNPPPLTNGGSSGWGQGAWMVPSSHVSWPHPYSIQSPPLVSAEQLGAMTSMRAPPPSALSTLSGSWTGHPSSAETHSPNISAASGHVLSPAPNRPAHLRLENGVDEYSIVVCDVGVKGDQHQHRPQEESTPSEDDRPIKIRRLDTGDVGGTVTRGCDRCLKVLQNGIYQCANCKENYRIATSPKQSSPDVNPVLLSEFFGHLQGLGVLEQVVSAIASEQLQARLGLKRAEEEYRELESEHEDTVHRKTLKAKELTNLTNELRKLIESNGGTG